MPTKVHDERECRVSFKVIDGGVTAANNNDIEIFGITHDLPQIGR